MTAGRTSAFGRLGLPGLLLFALGTGLAGSLMRWYEVVGTGEFMRALESRVAWARDRLRSVITGKPTVDSTVKAAVETGIESVVRAARWDRSIYKSSSASCSCSCTCRSCSW